MSRKDKGGGEGIPNTGPFPQVFVSRYFQTRSTSFILSCHVKDNQSRGTVLSGYVTKTRNGERETGNRERGTSAGNGNIKTMITKKTE